MHLHGPTLLDAQGARLPEDGIGYENLANVMQQGADEQRSHLVREKPHFYADDAGEVGHGP
jgi:hypothetical protein